MPRDGSGIYSQPFPAVVEGTTIESAVYNGYTADITIDLNTPRPISSGGTGANNAADAMAALGGEGSKIEVTNYDSHAFTAGSFYSKASASNPPVTGHAFAGICYVAVVSGVATSDMFIEVRDRDEATQPGSLFVRQKKNGTWSGWLKAVGTTTGATPPIAPTDGMLWWDPTQGKLFIWYSDPNTAQWVEAVATPDLGPDDFVSVDVAQSFTETEKKTARSNIYAAPFDALAYNGMQINGSMDVSQELGATPRTTNGYICDGWMVNCQSPVVLNSQAGGVAGLAGFTRGLSLVVATAQPSLAAGDSPNVTTIIEGYRFSRVSWGNVSPQPITVGFWTAHHRTGIYSVAARNATSSRSCVVTYTQNVADAWEYKTVTIPACTDGAWDITNGAGLQLGFILGCGTTYTAPSAGVWHSGVYVAAPGQVNGVAATSDVFRLTGVVVLPGTEAPSAARSPLIMRPYDQELVTCQRYYSQRYYLQNLSFFGVKAPGAGFSDVYKFPVTMRAIPTMALLSTGGWVFLNSGAGPVALTGVTASALSVDFGMFQAGSVDVDSVPRIYKNTAFNNYISADARL